jgi:hypothetical protein
MSTLLPPFAKCLKLHVDRNTLSTLERCVLEQIQEFKPQEIANTLYTMVKHSHKPTESLRLVLEQGVEVISGEFNSQNVANTLWALATMRTKSGDRMMGQLERWVEAISGEFTS